MNNDIHGRTITETMHTAVRTMLNHPNPDAVLNIESHLYHVCLTAESCEYTLDVGKHLWLNKQRWSRLIKEYVPREHLERFVAQAKEIVRGDARQGATANMQFRDPDRYEKKHRWGGCLMGATFHGSPKHGEKPCITFYSRTTYIGYMGLLDAAIAHVLAREIMGAGNESEVSFRWHITSCQLHCFKTLPFVYSQPDLVKRIEQLAKAAKGGRKRAANTPPTWWNMAKWYAKVLEHYGQHGVNMLAVEKYGPFKRIKRRWLEFKGHLKKAVPPSLLASSLTFEKAQ